MIKKINENLAVGIVLYKEDKNFKDRLNSLINNNYIVYIYDNSPASGYSKSYLKKTKNVKYLTCGQNVGLAIAMSTICAQAYYDNDSFDKLFFLDQDTVFSPETIEFVRNISINFKDYLAISFSNDKTDLEKIQSFNENNIKDVMLVRNSGTLFNLHNLSKVNWFDKNFFTDGVDYEFCLKAKLNGLKIGLYKGIPGFDHESEQGFENYSFYGKNIFYRKYSFSRIRDVISSSIKLIVSAIKNVELKYFLLVLRHTMVFLLLQMLIRLSKNKK